MRYPRSRIRRLLSLVLGGLMVWLPPGRAVAVSRPTDRPRNEVPRATRRVSSAATLVTRAVPAQERQDRLIRLPGHVLPALARATRVVAAGSAGAARGEDASAEPLTVTLVLKRDDQAGFDRYLRDVYDRASQSYGRFLSQGQLADRFGPSRRGYGAVLTHLRKHGLQVVEGSENRLTITVEGTRKQVDRAFRVRIDDYEAGGRRFHANDRDPALPADVAAHVQAVTGLSNLAQPEGTRAAAEAIALVLCLVPFTVGYYVYGTGGFGDEVFPPYFRALGKCLRALKYALAYGKNLSNLDPPPPTWNDIDGRGQTVGIIAFDSFDRQDVADYLALAGEPANLLDNLSEVPVAGGVAPGPEQDEVLLDVAAVMSVAPGARVVVYSSPFAGPGVSFQRLFNAAINGGSTIITNSFAYCEDQTTAADVRSIDAILASAAASGISVFNASGDTGSTCLNGSPNTIAVPASSPHATAVGGSSLTFGPGQTYRSETWWDGTGHTPPTGRGGFGTSRYFARPPYQDGLVESSARSIPDVVANADPANGVAICRAGGGGCPTGLLYGGTSLAAPLWAGFTALLNQARGSNLGALNPLLYPLAAAPGAFHTAAELGSDVAHVGLGSPNLDVLHSYLTGQFPGTASASASEVVALVESTTTGVGDGVSIGLPADGLAKASVIVRLIDANGLYLSGKTVTLAADGGSATITPPSIVIPAESRAAVFSVTDTQVETVRLAATDVTDAVVVDQTATVTFVVPPATSAGIAAFPTAITADGVSTTTITVTLRDTLGRPTPGKTIVLAQGGGHSVVVGPDPPVTDENGQIRFTATNLVNETVTYTAVDVTDGNLPVPGGADVVFSNGAGTACGNNTPPPTGENGYTLTPFVSGFATGPLSFGNVNFGACTGASAPGFTGGNVYLTNFFNGDVFRLGAGGGVVSSANRLATLGPTLQAPAVGKDGRIYAARIATTGDFNTGAIVELDPDTGAVARTVAANRRCPFGPVVDPLSGDLFFDGGCSGAGSDDPGIYRVRNPGDANPTVELYATLPSTPNGTMAFAPNGTLYVVAGYFGARPTVMRVSGTNGPTLPALATLPDLYSYFWVNVAEADADGEARSLIILNSDGLKLVDLTTTPPAETVLARELGGGAIGPDGCLYAPAGNAIYKLTNPTGGCNFLPGSARPSLTLTPAAVSPDPLQGSSQTFTAKFNHLPVPEGTAVIFEVIGATKNLRMLRTNAAGEAELDYTGLAVGTDRIIATATIGDDVFRSNEARVTWAPGKHGTFLTLNQSPRAGTARHPVEVTASLTDVSATPPVPVAGARIEFVLGGQRCWNTTDATGLASCQFILDSEGTITLTAAFTGTSGYVAASDSVAFDVAAFVRGCAGDCNGDNEVTIDELIKGVNIALGLLPLDACPAFDTDGDTHVTVDEIIQAVQVALNGCS